MAVGGESFEHYSALRISERCWLGTQMTPELESEIFRFDYLQAKPFEPPVFISNRVTE